MDTCERILLTTSSKWEALPRMAERRGGFNPCVLQNSIYLCGGWVKMLEVYHPAENRMETLPARLPESTFALSYLYQDCICVLTCNYFCKFRPEPYGFVTIDTQEHSKQFSPWTNVAPVVVGEYVYSVKVKQCVKYPLELVHLDN